MILDLDWHLQRHCLGHKASQLVATCLITHGDLDQRVVGIVHKSQWHGDGQLPLIDIKIFIEPLEPVQRRRWELWGANAQSFRRRDRDRNWDKALGDRWAIHVQASVDVKVDRQPEPLKGAIGGRVKARCHLYTLGLGMDWGTVHGAGQAKAPFQDRYARLALAIALLK